MVSYKFSRVDSNQPEIVKAFRELGWSVLHTHTIGSGAPDIIVAKNGFTACIEIKDGAKPPSQHKLTPDEIKFSSTWQGVYCIIKSIDDVMGFNEQNNPER